MFLHLTSCARHIQGLFTMKKITLAIFVLVAMVSCNSSSNPLEKKLSEYEKLMNTCYEKIAQSEGDESVVYADTKLMEKIEALNNELTEMESEMNDEQKNRFFAATIKPLEAIQEFSHSIFEDEDMQDMVDWEDAIEEAGEEIHGAVEEFSEALENLGENIENTLEELGK